MIKNELGATLHTVLLMFLIFTILGVTIVSVSIGGTKRTEHRKEEVVTNLAEIKKINETVAYIQATIKDEYDPDTTTIATYNAVIDKMKANPNYSITDITSEESIDSNKYFTRVLKVTSENYAKKVYITGMPSFLKYAIGSRGHLTLNGSVYVKEGNLYANTGFTITNTAKYVYGNKNLTKRTSFPSVLDHDNSSLFLEKDIASTPMKYCKSENNDTFCYQGKNPVDVHFQPLTLENLNQAFGPVAPTYTTEKTEFVDVDILKTFSEKLKDGGFNDEEIQTLIHTDNIVNPIDSNVKTITTIDDTSIITTNETDSTIKSYLYQGSPGNPAYIDTNNLVISTDKSKWLVIDGDAHFENIGNKTMNITGNILVTGNATMTGNLAFDSTIYVLGNTKVNNATITGIDDSELILMTEGDLELARFDKFNNNPKPNLIKAYLYTSKSATVYAVGSRINITGGLFAKGDLEINAFRGKTEDGSNDLLFDPDIDNNIDDNVDASRLVMTNNKTLFIHQAQGLPKVDKFEVITDLIEKKTK